MVGCSTRALKTDLRDQDLSSGSMWSRVRPNFTARTEQSCHIRIKAPACPCRGKVVYWDMHWIWISSPLWNAPLLPLSLMSMVLPLKRFHVTMDSVKHCLWVDKLSQGSQASQVDTQSTATFSVVTVVFLERLGTFWEFLQSFVHVSVK